MEAEAIGSPRSRGHCTKKWQQREAGTGRPDRPLWPDLGAGKKSFGLWPGGQTDDGCRAVSATQHICHPRNFTTTSSFSRYMAFLISRLIYIWKSILSSRELKIPFMSYCSKYEQCLSRDVKSGRYGRYIVDISILLNSRYINFTK